MENFKTLHKNTVIYGHNMRHDDLIFGMLEDYRTPDGFKKAPVIECNTIYGDYTWLVYGVFITNSDPDDDNGYCLPYNFIDVDNQKFADYIAEIDKRKLYSTGVDINENDKILTLQACVYDFDGAMIVVVAREKREGESISVDTSKAYKNPNPKFPQKWYDVNKKDNPYEGDPRW
jgi:sortase B